MVLARPHLAHSRGSLRTRVADPGVFSQIRIRFWNEVGSGLKIIVRSGPNLYLKVLTPLKLSFSRSIY